MKDPIMTRTLSRVRIPGSSDPLPCVRCSVTAWHHEHAHIRASIEATDHCPRCVEAELHDLMTALLDTAHDMARLTRRRPVDHLRDALMAEIERAAA